MPATCDDQLPESDGQILILTGAPGSGKTTTARALARQAGGPAVHLHADDFWHVIQSGAIPPYLPAAHAQNRTVMRALAQAAASYAEGGFLVVVDGIVGPWFLSPFHALAVPLHYVVLRVPLPVALERCRRRGGDTLTASGPIASLHGQFAALGGLERHALDLGAAGPAQTLEAVGQALASGRFRLSPDNAGRGP
jgi:chloramphenicol 3-O-phosphotransferase